jgi:hypothetical protein
MLQALSTRHNRTQSLFLFGGSVLLAIAAVLIGVDDNPPGIFLAFLSATALVLVFVHPWRIAKQYRALFVRSALAILGFIIVHNVLDTVAAAVVNAAPLHILLESLSILAFLVSVLLGPTALIIGLVGWLVMTLREGTAATE